MANRETKRQHYVPKTYLKHFATERNGEYFLNALPISDFKEDKIQEINIDKVCLQKDLYTLPGDTPEERMLIERFYSDNYENHYDRVYKLLTDPNKNSLNDEERELIISTVVIMFYRTTKWISTHNEVLDRVFEQMYMICQQTGQQSFKFGEQKISLEGKTLDQVKREHKAENRPGQVITQLQVALRLIQLRCQKDGIYVTKLVDDDCEFVTSDNPVNYSNIFADQVLPFDPDNMLSLPLDNKYKLYLMPDADEESKHFLIRHNVSGTMCFSEKLTSNYEQSTNAERFMLGNDAALKSYLKTKEFSEKPLSEVELKRTESSLKVLEKGKELVKRLRDKRTI